MLDISLRPEYIVSVGGFALTNTFLTSVLVTILLFGAALFFYYDKGNETHIFIKIVRVLIWELLKLIDTVTESRSLSKKILPLASTFFIFIIVANLLGLIPGYLGSFYMQTVNGKVALLRSPNSDLTITLALAFLSVFAIQFFSLQELGLRNYIKRFINLTNPINFIIGFFDLLSEGVKILSFSFRLFGNLFAGEILLLITAFLVPYILPLPFMILEIFVGIIQAFIFTMLTLTFIKTNSLKKKEVLS
jgi:F-type H+-transporting ATPase subunit a